MKSSINLYGRKTTENTIECLSRFNSGAETIVLRAYGGNVAKGIEVAQMLGNEFLAKIIRSEVKAFGIDGVEIPCLELEIKMDKRSRIFRKPASKTLKTRFQGRKKEFINYSTYSILADWYLQKEGSLNVYLRNGNPMPLLKICARKNQTEKGIQIHPDLNDQRKKRFIGSWIFDQLNSSLIRSGVLQPEHWKAVGKKISEHDDIIIGLDTNVLYNCTISEHIVPLMALVQTENYVNRPNWIMLVVPGMVMQELEATANNRNEGGELSFTGRIAYRALQEIMELKRNTDIQGLTLVISGKSDPVSSLKEDLKAIIAGINDSKNSNRPIPKSSAGDASIRSQFKDFVQKIDFHKGTYFLTSDKSCAAMAMAESLDPVYLKLPPYQALGGKNGAIPSFFLNSDNDEPDLVFDVPIGSILYELAVSFGEIVLGFGEENTKSITLSCDRKGESLHRWVHKQLLVDEKEFTEWLEEYEGPIHLEEAFLFFKKITERFEGENWLFEMDSPWKIT